MKMKYIYEMFMIIQCSACDQTATRFVRFLFQKLVILSTNSNSVVNTLAKFLANLDAPSFFYCLY